MCGFITGEKLNNLFFLIMRTYVLGIAQDETCDATRVRGWKSKTETIKNKSFFFLQRETIVV